MEIKERKSVTVKFVKRAGRLESRWISGGRRTNGLEYLGFRFDGQRIFFRDSTLANLNRKIARAVRAVVTGIVARYPGKDESFVMSQFSVERFMQRYGRDEEFDENQDYRNWTFWSYARRAVAVMGMRALPIYHQLRRQRH